MTTDPLIALQGLEKVAAPQLTGTVNPAGGEDFQSVLSKSMSEISEMNKSAEESISKLVSGEVKDMHQVMIAVEKANLTFATMMQVRNKLLDAYREVMNMRF